MQVPPDLSPDPERLRKQMKALEQESSELWLLSFSLTELGQTSQAALLHLSSSAVITTSSTLTCSDCSFPGLEALFVHVCMVPCTVGCPVWSVPLSSDKDLTWARWGIQLLGEASVPRFTEVSQPPPGVKLTQGCAAFNSKVSALGLGFVSSHSSLSFALCQGKASGATWESSRIMEWAKNNLSSHRELTCGTTETRSCNPSSEHMAKHGVSEDTLLLKSVCSICFHLYPALLSKKKSAGAEAGRICHLIAMAL